MPPSPNPYLAALFADVAMSTLTPPRIASLVERSDLTHESILRAFNWTPTRTDITLVGPPVCGQELVAKMIQMLLAKDVHELEAAHGRSAVSLLESRRFDATALPQDQRRVLQTNFSYEAMRHNNKLQHGKTIVLLRHPKDLREVWYKHLRSTTIQALLCQDPSAMYQVSHDFDDRFSVDDFAAVPLTLVDAPNSEVSDHVLSYEENLSQWLNVVNELPNVKLLCLEDVLANPEHVLDDLALFLELPPADPFKLEDILLHTTGQALLNTSTFGHVLTASQTRMLKYRFVYVENDDDHPRPDLLELMDESPLLSPRGFFSSEYYLVENGTEGFSTDSCLCFDELWRVMLGDAHKTYAVLFKFLNHCEYPVAHQPAARSKSVIERVLSFRTPRSPGSSRRDSSSSASSGRRNLTEGERQGRLMSPIVMARKVMQRPTSESSVSTDEAGKSLSPKMSSPLATRRKNDKATLGR